MGLADSVVDGIKDFTGLDLDFMKDIFASENLAKDLPNFVKENLPSDIRDKAQEIVDLSKAAGESADQLADTMKNLIPEEYQKLLPEDIPGVSAPSSGCSESSSLPGAGLSDVFNIDGLSLSDPQIQNGIDKVLDLEPVFENSGFFDLDGAKQNPILSEAVKFFGSVFGDL